MRIGELAARTGASIRSLRYYEECGLIASTRSASGQRHFSDDSTERVALIRKLLSAGLGTTAIADVLPCLADPTSQTTMLTTRLIDERNRFDAEILARTLMRDALDVVIKTTPQPSQQALRHSDPP